MADLALSIKHSTLDRKRHIEALVEALRGPQPIQYAPAQTWMLYWISHSLSLLEQTQYVDSVAQEAIQFLSECADKNGGYGGGPGQIPHLATTFAAVNSLITFGREDALESIDRVSLVRFLHRMKNPDGSFYMHENGEIDSRATYCALVILRVLNINDELLLQNVPEWILSCQTYEGGFGSVPGSEAHGGYTFCCVASLCLLNQLHRADVPSLLRWLTNKQLSDEGGFCGRSNKLVDSCYSYWQGAVFPLVQTHLSRLRVSPNTSQEAEMSKNSETTSETNATTPGRRQTRSLSKEMHEHETSKSEIGQQYDKILSNWLLDCHSLQDYILNSCQASDGLFKDKPGVIPDLYHTCYALSGLSISQHQPNDSQIDVGSQPINLLAPTHPLFNVTSDNLNYCFNYFENKSIQIQIGECDADQ